MNFTAQQIADYLNGKVDGDANISVSSISKIEEGKSGTLSFLANPQYLKYIYETEASIVLVNNEKSMKIYLLLAARQMIWSLVFGRHRTF